MNKTNFSVKLIVLPLSFFCSIFFIPFILTGCWRREDLPERNFNVSDWEIPISLFPEGAFTDHISVPTDNMVGEIEGGFQTVYIDYGVAIYNIYRFPRIKEAISQFEHEKKDMVNKSTGEAWKVPDDLIFSSTTADDLYIACGYWSDRYRCKMTALYEEYVIFFNADINEKMTFKNFESVVFYLDDQISKRLYP